MWSIKNISKIVLATILAFSTISYFLPSTDSASAATTENALVNTKDSDLTVRKGPGTNYKKVGSLKKGKSVTVYSKTKSGWSEIRYNDKKAYVSTKYLLFSPVKITKKKYKNISDLSYPQVSGLKNKKAQDKINQTFTNHAKKAYKSYVKIQQKDKEDKNEDWCNGKTCNYEYMTIYKVKYNQDGKLSILLNDYIYEGGAHGMAVVTSYNFKVSSGKQVKIADILTSKQKYTKVQNYAYKYMSTHDGFYVDKQSDVPVNKNSQFYYSKDGIYLIFQEYDVAPYSAGTPSVKIPSSVYK
ncbi:PdaC/SigV domain-containing protein [Peribacillus sp. NPDC097295]|uniref:PdaC/SigV domain-containing protein n=1 Tax=Peribacillus sp. NPDC097295 TaxID=3364402 RepID=UPI00380E65D3